MNVSESELVVPLDAILKIVYVVLVLSEPERELIRIWYLIIVNISFYNSDNQFSNYFCIDQRNKQN